MADHTIKPKASFEVTNGLEAVENIQRQLEEISTMFRLIQDQAMGLSLESRTIMHLASIGQAYTESTSSTASMALDDLMKGLHEIVAVPWETKQ